MLDKYIIKDNKKLRYGYTTGTCAAGAGKAAAGMLFSGKIPASVEITTPFGWKLNLPVLEGKIEKDHASCCIVKDSGDDPDVTHGIKIYGKAMRNKEIEITGGTGIGIVTKKGLAVAPGNYAINPGPMKMIRDAVKEVLPEGEGVKVEISAPQGVEIAKKTLNGKLGITGGISILGTTGIVEPMSEEAIKETLAVVMSVIKGQGNDRVIFVPGNYGKDFIGKELNLREDIIVKTSNFIGYMLDKAVEYGISEILWVGHIGKLVKVAGGIFNTHSKIADVRMEILAANCAVMGTDREVIRKIMESNTTEEAVEYIKENNLSDVFNIIADKVSRRCEEYVKSRDNHLFTGTGSSRHL
jgi:cobalt-precorrin-5B (C1)-methyltransferase